jgi:hydrogenase maturation factor HypF (carbamoyltransferase family)
MSQVTKCDICGVTEDEWHKDHVSDFTVFRITVKRRWYSGGKFEDVDICPDCLREIRNKRKEQ